MKLSSTSLMAGAIFLGALSANANHINEVRIFGSTGVAGNEPTFESRFTPYDSDSEGIGTQLAEFSEDHSIQKGISYSRWFNENWGLRISYQFGERNYTSSADPHITFEWAQWSPTAPFPIRTRDETIPVERHPELQYDQKTLGLDALYRIQKDRWTFGLQAGLIYHQNDGIELNNVYFKTSTQVSRGSLLSSEHYLRFEADNTQQLGANVGMDISYAITNHVSAFADVRYHWVSGKTSALTLVDFEAINNFWVADEWEEINTLYQSKEIELDSSNLYVSVGISIGF